MLPGLYLPQQMLNAASCCFDSRQPLSLLLSVKFVCLPCYSCHHATSKKTSTSGSCSSVSQGCTHCNQQLHTASGWLVWKGPHHPTLPTCPGHCTPLYAVPEAVPMFWFTYSSWTLLLGEEGEVVITPPAQAIMFLVPRLMIVLRVISHHDGDRHTCYEPL
jgi:hypothetical protein